MANIDIDFENVSSSNAKIPRYITTLTGIRRELEIIKWKLNRDAMDERDMQQRYDHIIKMLSLTEDKLEAINKSISRALMEYEYTETVNVNIAKRL